MSTNNPHESARVEVDTGKLSTHELPQLPNDNPIYALVIGINNYQVDGYNNLSAAVADADAIETFLVNRLKALPQNIVSLRDAEATRQGILDAFKALEMNTAATVDPCIIIYFAGHGARSPRPDGWENRTTDRDCIEQLCPSDMGAGVDGQVVEGIPDRVICALLNSLAEKRGNNITLILDCCHSAGINRHEGPGRISRCILNPPPLTVEANLPLYLAIQERSADPVGGTGAVRSPSGFGNAHDHSHILLAACGKEQSAYELDDRSHGIFTSRLLKFFESGRLEEVTYETLMNNLDMPKWQTAHCMGAYANLPLFNRRGNRSDPSYWPCKRSKSAPLTFTLHAGEAQGIVDGQQFSIHERIPFEGGNPSQPSIGKMHVVSLGLNSSRLEFLPDLDLSGPRPQVPRVFYAHPLSWGKQDPSMIYCQDRKLLNAIFPGEEMKYAEYPTKAALILTVEGGQVHIDQNDPVLNDYIPTRFACSINRNETQKLQNIIRSWRHFNYHLHRRPRISTDVFPLVRMELHYLQATTKDYLITDSYTPVGENLLKQEPAHVQVSNVESADAPESLLGMTVYNDGPKAVYPYLFYFDPNDLTITPWAVLASGPVPLLPYSKLTLGYGNVGATPWEFVFVGQRTEDVGFFKLFLSSEPANFACLTRRKTPFKQRDEQRHGEELDREAKEAERLKNELDNSAKGWGVKMATVIQIKK